MTHSFEVSFSDEEYARLKTAAALYHRNGTVPRLVEWYIKIALQGGLPIPDPQRFDIEESRRGIE